MALTDVNGHALKWEVILDTRKAEADHKAFIQKIQEANKKHDFGGLDTKPVSKALADITRESQKTAVVTQDLRTGFDLLTGSMQGVHMAIAKSRTETQTLTQTERDLRKALKDNLITEDEYIKKLALISAKRTELSNKLKEYRSQLKLVEVEKTKAKPYTAEDTAREVKNANGTSTIVSGPVVNAAELERARLANEAYAASVKNTTGALGGQAVASKVVVQSNQAQMASLEALKLELADYRIKAAQATDPAKLKLYNAEIQTLEGEVKRMSNAGKVGFDDMGNVLVESTKKANIFTRALTGTWSIVRKLAYFLPGLGVAGILAFAIDPISKYIKSLNLFESKLSDIKQAQKDLSKEMGSAGEAAAKATLDVAAMAQKFKQARDGVITKASALKTYNEGIGKTLGFTKDLNVAEERTIKNGGAYIDLMFKKARAAAVMKLYTEQMSKAAEAMAKTSDEAGSYIMSGTKGSGLTNAEGVDMFEANAQRNREKEAKPFIDRAEAFKNMWLDSNKEIEDFAKKNKLILDPSDTIDAGSIQSAANMYQKIADLRNEYSRKVLSTEEAEVQAVKDKFDKIINEVKRFNDNPKNKVKVNLESLDSLKSDVISDLRYKQDTEKLKIELERQKQLYSEYENFKLETSKEKADKRYGAERAKFDTFSDYLESQKQPIEQKEVKDRTREEVERLKYLDAQLEAERKRMRDTETANYLKAYEASKTHFDRLEDIEADYYRNVAALGENATMEQLRVLEEARDQRISDEVAANLKIETNWEETFENMYKMSRKASVEYLKEVKKRIDGELAAGKLTRKEYKQMAKEIDEALSGNTSSYSKLSTSFKKYIDAIKLFGKESEESKTALKELANEAVEATQKVNAVIGAIAQSVQQLGIGDEKLDKALSNVMGVVDGFGEISKGIADKDPIAVITGSIKLLTNVIDLFNVKDKKLQKQIDNYKKQLDSLGKAYRQLEKDINNSIGNSYYADSEKAIANMQNQIVLIEQMRRAEQDKKKTDKGKLADYDDQIQGLKDNIEQTQQAISEMLLQTNYKALSQTLANALVSAFETGESAIDALNNTFDDFIKNAVANSLKLKVLEPIIKDFTDELSSYMQTNDNSLVGFDFNKWKRDLAEGANLFTGSLEGVLDGLGIDLTSDKQTGQGMTGTIGRSITENTANRLEGQFNGMRLAQIRMMEAVIEQTTIMNRSSAYAFENLSTALAIERNTFRTADNTDRLKAIEYHLRSIDSKSKDLTAFARGAGYA